MVDHFYNFSIGVIVMFLLLIITIIIILINYVTVEISPMMYRKLSNINNKIK